MWSNLNESLRWRRKTQYCCGDGSRNYEAPMISALKEAGNRPTLMSGSGVLIDRIDKLSLLVDFGLEPYTPLLEQVLGCALGVVLYLIRI